MQASGLAKSVTVEDSFRSCLGLAAAESVLRVLGPDLLARLREEAEVRVTEWSFRGSCGERPSEERPCLGCTI